MRATLQQRLLLGCEPEPNTGCWLWVGPQQKRTLKASGEGYGYLNRDGKRAFAHRAAYEAFTGAIPVGQNVLHRCDIRLCVNPAHLWLGTQKANIQDASQKGRLVKSFETRTRMSNARVVHGRFARRLGQKKEEKKDV